MAKKKNSMALFEVISKTRDKNPDSEVIVPEWVRPGYNKQPDEPTAAPEPAPVESPTPEPQAPEQVAPTAPVQQPVEPARLDESPPEPVIQEPLLAAPAAPATVTPPPTVTPVTPEPIAAVSPEPIVTPEPVVAVSPEPMTTASAWQEPVGEDTPQTTNTPKNSGIPIWNTDGERLTLSLNYVSCMVASIGLLLLLAVAFVTGRMTASPAAPVAAKPVVIQRELGKYYMVIETLPGRGAGAQAEAKRIADFCIKNGEPAEVKALNNNVIVWSATPFDTASSEAVSAHARRIQNDLGVKYDKLHASGYKFIQPQKNGKIAPKMYVYQKRR
ncbi:MAG: hypothetical protein HN350_06810 [Phycisphaerales bacterium]|nr:hypothetical protein [Phycisphaerales bacterium]